MLQMNGTMNDMINETVNGTTSGPAATGAAASVNPESLASGVDLLALESQVCFGLAVAARGVIGAYRPILEPLGLALWQASPRTVRDLGEALQLEPATLSPLLKRLEAAGYITRARNANDERALDITLTDAGRALREQALGIPPQVIKRLGMSLDELATLRATLARVIEAVGAE